MPIFDSTAGEDSQIRRGRFHILPIILFGLFAGYYYFSHQEVNEYTGRKQLIDMSPEQEAALGLQSYREVLSESSVIKTGPGVQEVNSVGARLAKAANEPNYQWAFSLVDSAEVNAFCLPGGKVVVYSGILPVAQDEDSLAVVMGHEIGHALSHHGAERMAQQKLAQYGQIAVNAASSDMGSGRQRAVLAAFGLGAQYGVLLPFSRKHESEADYIGLILMARACFNPEAAIPFWERMAHISSSHGSPPEFASTHPSDSRRIEQIRAWMPEALAERAKHCPS